MLSLTLYLITVPLFKCSTILNQTIKETDYIGVVLWIIYNQKTNYFEQLLEKDNSASIHQRNIQTLFIETYKVTNALPSELMKKHLNEDENFIMTFAERINLQFHLFAVFITVEILFHILALKYGNL